MSLYGSLTIGGISYVRCKLGKAFSFVRAFNLWMNDENSVHLSLQVFIISPLDKLHVYKYKEVTYTDGH